MTKRDETEEFVEDDDFFSELYNDHTVKIADWKLSGKDIPPAMDEFGWFLTPEKIKILTKRQLYKHILNFRIEAIDAYNARDLYLRNYQGIVNIVYILIIVFLVLTGTYH